MSKLKKQNSELSPAALQLLVDLVFQYWKIKRTSNYGLPLIRVVSADTIEELQKERRNDILRLRVNLERIRNLSYMIIRREKNKRSWVQSHREIVEKALSVLTGVPLPSTSSDDADEKPPDNGHDRYYAESLPVNEKVALIKEVVSADNIYNDIEEQQAEIKILKTKRLLRDINRLVKVERVKAKPNPYAKVFCKRKCETSETSCDTHNHKEKKPSTNNNHHSPTMPLKNKCVPTNVLKLDIKPKLELVCELSSKLKKIEADRRSPIKSPIKSKWAALSKELNAHN